MIAWLATEFNKLDSSSRTSPATSALATCQRDSSCAVCHFALRNRKSVDLGSARLVWCDSCGSWTYTPRFDGREQLALHDTSEYFDHPYFRARREDSNLNLERCREIFAAIGTVLELASLEGERVLDIGCDTGSLLLAAVQIYGVVPFGLDVSSRAVDVSRGRGLQVFHGTVDDAPQVFSCFKLVTAVDVLEHTTEPAVFLRQVYERIVPGGFLYLQTPNFDSIIYQLGRQICNLTKGRPRASMERLFPAQHAQYFSRAGLAILAERSGFQVAHVEARVLPARDIVASSPVRAGLAALQVIDRVLRREILLCTVLRKPV